MSASVRRAVPLNDNSTGQPGTIDFVTDHTQDQAGDIVIIATSENNGVNTCSLSGFTLLAGPDDNAANSLRTYIFARKLTSADVASDTTFTITWTSGGRTTNTAQVIQGSNSQVSDIVVSAVSKAATNSISNAALTVSGDSLISAQVFARIAAASQVAITPDAAFTEGAECNTNFASSPNYAGSTNRKTTNASSNIAANTYTWTATSGATHMQMYLLAIPTGVANVPPTANAGADQTNKTFDTLVTLSGSDSDSDGTVVTRAWSQVSGTSVTLSGASTATATFNVPHVFADETLVFRYTVTDNSGASTSDDINIGILKHDGLHVFVVNSGATVSRLTVSLVDTGSVLRTLGANTP